MVHSDRRVFVCWLRTWVRCAHAPGRYRYDTFGNLIVRHEYGYHPPDASVCSGEGRLICIVPILEPPREHRFLRAAVLQNLSMALGARSAQFTVRWTRILNS